MKFELELKNQLFKLFQNLLIDNRIQQFEHKLCKQFYSHSFGSLNLNSPYTDWLLLDFLRYIKVNEKNYRQRINIVRIFKQFEYLHDFKLQTFRTTLDNSLILNDNSNYAEFTSVIIIPYLKIQKKRNI